MELFEADLKANYRVRALVGKWLDEQMKEERVQFEMINRFTLHVDSSKKLNEMNLYQAAYFVDRELQFYEEVSLVWQKKRRVLKLRFIGENHRVIQVKVQTLKIKIRLTD